jgi:hypothetical protein
MDLQGCW